MKKRSLILGFLILFLGVNLVFAANQNAGQANNSLNKNTSQDTEKNQTRLKNETNNNQGIGQELSNQIRLRKEEIKSGDYNGSLGQLLRVRELAQNLRQLRVNNVSAQTNLNLTSETDLEGKTKLKIKLKNGQEREIKIMPDRASETALQRLRLRVCNSENNCSLELKEIGNKNKSRLAYEVQVQRHSKILGIFQKKMQVRVQVDAENGEVIRIKKPWWAFLASEPEE